MGACCFKMEGSGGSSVTGVVIVFRYACVSVFMVNRAGLAEMLADIQIEYASNV